MVNKRRIAGKKLTKDLEGTGMWFGVEYFFDIKIILILFKGVAEVRYDFTIFMAKQIN